MLTTKQADKFIGKQIVVRWPSNPSIQPQTIVIVSRERGVVTTAAGQRFELRLMELVNQSSPQASQSHALASQSPTAGGIQALGVTLSKPMNQDIKSPPARIFKSHDPLWPMWGATPEGWNTRTRWFYRKADAERFLKTGDDSKAITR